MSAYFVVTATLLAFGGASPLLKMQALGSIGGNHTISMASVGGLGNISTVPMNSTSSAPSPSGAVGLDTDAIIAICVGIASPVVSIGIALVTYYACVRPRRVVDDTGRESADRQRSGVSTPAPRAGSPDSDTETESIDRRRSKVSTLAPREGSLDSDSEMPQRPRSVHPSTVGLTRRRSMLLPRLSQDRSLSGYGDDATTCHPPVVDSHRDKPPCCS